MSTAPTTPRGFTLIELLVVISIISVLATLGMFVLPIAIKEAKITRAKTEISNMAMCVKNYKNDYGVYPDDTSSESVANALTGYKSSPDNLDDFSKDPDWHGPYITTKPSQHELGMKNKAIVDPWGKPYQYKLRKPVHNVGDVDIWSSGPDMNDDKGTGDDITNWK